MEYAREIFQFLHADRMAFVDSLFLLPSQDIYNFL